MFSYGSGTASSMFLLKIHQNVDFMRKEMNIKAILQNRIRVAPEEFMDILQKKENVFGKPNLQTDVKFKLFYFLNII